MIFYFVLEMDLLFDPTGSTPKTKEQKSVTNARSYAKRKANEQALHEEKARNERKQLLFDALSSMGDDELTLLLQLTRPDKKPMVIIKEVIKEVVVEKIVIVEVPVPVIVERQLSLLESCARYVNSRLSARLYNDLRNNFTSLAPIKTVRAQINKLNPPITVRQIGGGVDTIQMVCVPLIYSIALTMANNRKYLTTTNKVVKIMCDGSHDIKETYQKKSRLLAVTWAFAMDDMATNSDLNTRPLRIAWCNESHDTVIPMLASLDAEIKSLRQWYANAW
jgi:hypothetical protein